MEKQVRIYVSGGNVQRIETNFDECKFQIIDFDNLEDNPKLPEPIEADYIFDINKDIFNLDLQ